MVYLYAILIHNVFTISLCMKKSFLLLFFIILSVSEILGQSAQGRYSSRMTVDGTIFFIEPCKLKELDNIRKFEYDMTLLSWTDSVTVNFTFETNIMSMPHDLRISSNQKEYICKDFSSLFIDIKKNHYEIRITSQFSVDEVSQILNSEDSPTFVFTQDDVTNRASYTKRSWKKDRNKLLSIFKLYSYSKKQP